MILLDTNAASAILNRHPRRVSHHYRDRVARGLAIATSSIVVLELEFGIANSRHQQVNEQSVGNLLAALSEILSFDAEDGRAAGMIRASLRAAGTPIGPFHVLIASQALRHGATLVTANVPEFNRIQGLAVEDWG